MFIKTYYQHIMDVLINCFHVTYDQLEELYNDIFRHRAEVNHTKHRTIQADSLRTAHLRANRGNLLKGISPQEFYNEAIYMTLKNTATLNEFAARLYEALTEANVFPTEWVGRAAKIGASGPIDKPTFEKFIVYLLDHNRDPQQQLSTLEFSSGESPSLAFSRRFLTEGGLACVDADKDTFSASCLNLSRVFRDVVSFQSRNGADGMDLSADSFNLIDTLKNWVVAQLANGSNREILKMKGPLGSYKNRLIQLLYLALEREADTYLPVYIDLAAYERTAETNESIGDHDFLLAFKRDAKRLEAIFAKFPDKKPLLLMEGVRDFSCKNETFYYGISEYLGKQNWNVITSVDSSFTVNPQNKFDIHPLASTNYEGYLRIRSMNLYQKAESIAFIRNCIDVFGVALSVPAKPEDIYDALARLNFMVLDAFWLTFLLRSHLGDILNPETTLAGLYNALGIGFFGNQNKLMAAAKFAYDFEYGDGCFEGVNPYADYGWRFVLRHRSMLDFLIAKEYVRRVSLLTLLDNNPAHNRQELKIFEMVLQEYISRFIYGLLKGKENYECQIMRIVQHHYYDLSPIGKSELSFRMTGLQSKNRKGQCLAKIKQYSREAIQEYATINSDDIKMKKDMAFLIRSLNINLIYAGDDEAFAYYANLLLSDKLACSINRGFHLEFHGDKPYIPNKSLLDFEDDISKGFKAFSRNCMILDRRIIHRDKAVYAAAIEILSLCQLLQARMVVTDQPVLDIRPFAKKCLRYLDWILTKHPMHSHKKVEAYFRWMKGELTAFLENDVRHHKADVFNQINAKTLSAGSRVCQPGANKPHFGTDHVFSCWLIGMLYLPNVSNLHGYSKDDILQMLLMHDLGKKGFSAQDMENIGKLDLADREQKSMQALLLSGTYPDAVDLSHYYALWNAWSYGQGINFHIARDIDTIQKVYQFCFFCVHNPDQFVESDVFYHLDDLDELETAIGKEIADSLIQENPLFRDFFAAYFS